MMLTNQPPRPMCTKCKKTLAKSNGRSKHGFKQWHKYCVSCAKATYNSKFGYLSYKKTCCETCEFVPVDQCQLDLIYLDGNTKNKVESNLKTLCANCSRLFSKKLREKQKTILDITVDTDYRL